MHICIDVHSHLQYFYSHRSAGEHCTLYQLHNLINRCNVVKSPEKYLYACDDFFELVTTSHILTASLEVLGMKSLSQTHHLKLSFQIHLVFGCKWDKQRKQILTTVCEKIVHSYIRLAFHEVATPVYDNVNEYSRQLLSIGCLYLEFADAIREGDGLRVLRCWRYLLPIFKSSGRKTIQSRH